MMGKQTALTRREIEGARTELRKLNDTIAGARRVLRDPNCPDWRRHQIIGEVARLKYRQDELIELLREYRFDEAPYPTLREVVTDGGI
jgi:hypothetical protein